MLYHKVVPYVRTYIGKIANLPTMAGYFRGKRLLLIVIAMNSRD